jgi:putative ABC transport system ATP-binding protein
MLLRLEDVHKSFATGEGPIAVLSGVNLAVAAGESVALLGESGSGKSTCLHLIAGLDNVDRGRVEIDGQDLGPLADAERARLRRQTIGLVFQQFNLVPTLDAGANIALQARLAGRDDPAWRDEIAGALGLTSALARYPEELSGGQQQRVAIARALAARPRLVLADEPTGNLDEANADAVMDLFAGLIRRSGAALLMVTHSERLAARLDRQVRLVRGRIVA